MAQQTAVEWLVDQIKSDQNQKALTANEWVQVIEQAKQMEKDWIIHIYWVAYKEGHYSGDKTAEEYYNETFNK